MSVESIPSKEPKPQKTENTTPFLYNYSNLNTLAIQFLDLFAYCPFEPFHDPPALKYHSSVPFGNSIFLTGGLDESEAASIRTVEIKLCFDKLPPKTGSEKEYGCQYIVKKDMSTPRFFHGSTIIQGHIMVVGGLAEKGKATAECELFDIEGDTWKLVKPLPVALGFACIGAFKDNVVYVFGGATSDSPVHSGIYQYGYASNEWTEVSLNENQGWKGSAGSLLIQISSEQMLLFGGEGKSEAMRDSYLFDASKRALRKAARMKNDIKSEANAPTCVKKYEGKVFAVQNGMCSIYDIIENIWSTIQFTNSTKA